MSEERNDARPVVLIADDDEMLRMMAREALIDDFQVLVAEDGRRAIELFHVHQPDAVLLDVVMPELDGFQTCAGIREHPRGGLTPILMMTVSDDVESIHRSYELGATDFETKPINYLILRHRIHYLLKARRTLGELERIERRLSHAQSTARVGVWEYDVDSDALQVYDDASGILALPRERQDARDFFASTHPDDRSQLHSLFDAARREARPFRFQHRVMDVDGNVRHVYQDVAADEIDGRVVLTGVAQDVSRLKEIERQNFELAYYDVLTKLPNRNFLTKHLSHVLETGGAGVETTTLFSLDLDNFKRINDSLGRKAGDRFLVEVANRLLEAVRVGDAREQDSSGIAARLGDDEFFVAIQGLDDETAALSFGRYLLGHLSQPIEVDGQALFVTSSIGVAQVPAQGADPTELIQRAQSAMNEAKRLGRNRCTLFDPALDATADKRLSLEQSIRTGIERGEFRMLYQPKVDIRTGQLASVEALVRWIHPTEGAIAPNEFLPVAEDTGLIVSLGHWILNDVCRQLGAWRDQGLDIKVSVNCSGLQFERSDVARAVTDALIRSDVPPELLEIEITEGILLENDERVRDTLVALERIGVRIALDDFGTGYSSLSYLKKFPIHVVKIDRSFVADLDSSRDSAAIVAAIIALAQGLDLDVVAEGVETSAQADFLAGHGCVQHQGFLFSKPLTPSELERWLQMRVAAAGGPGKLRYSLA